VPTAISETECFICVLRSENAVANTTLGPGGRVVDGGMAASYWFPQVDQDAAAVRIHRVPALADGVFVG
jgi:hypothetical protein